ncbi:MULTISPECIES: quercetin 2,3-dioxygenase [Streptomyces]|uniref:Quercetin 2,3-dioxygenase n=1 Tax=Streptomyces solicathayae TaxID=3081768 RepID=A0ABZ0LZ72_9ACTN|nr:quercetin 2,3-dioxygenase [Streptomyces sp. HUAS YS2]WOX24660.1 quercetin 2,3-dioxygenase [Streptomyces sp. HUAS YS2]
MGEQMVTHKPGEGRSYWVLGGLYTVKVGAADTGGAMTVIEFTVREGMGPPPHTHDCSETVYVLEGRMRFHLDGEVVEAGPGSFVHIPAGVWEQPEPVGTAKFLSVYQPGGFEEFFAEVGEPATSNTLPPVPEGPPDIARIAEVGARYGMQVRSPEG